MTKKTVTSKNVRVHRGEDGIVTHVTFTCPCGQDCKIDKGTTCRCCKCGRRVFVSRNKAERKPSGRRFTRACGAGLALLALVAVIDQVIGAPGRQQVENVLVDAAGNPIQRAQLAKERIAAAEEAVDREIKAIHEHFREYNGSLVAEMRVLSDFRTLVPKLRENAVWLVENYPAFEAALNRYEMQLVNSPEKLRKAAAQYAMKAKELGEEHAINGPYLQLARDCTLGAERQQQEAQRIAALRTSTRERMKTVRDSIVFCDDFQAFLLLRDDGQREYIEEFLGHLDSYLSRFEETVSLFRNLSMANEPDAG